MKDYKTPGVYIEEIRKFPPSIAAVETAIPVFIGYTEQAIDSRGESLLLKPKKINSLLNYETFFGTAQPETGFTVDVRENAGLTQLEFIKVNLDTAQRSKYLMYYAMQIFFNNGGGDCYILSVDTYDNAGGQVSNDALTEALELIRKVDEVTLIVFPDAVNVSSATNYYGVYNQALKLCKEMQDRFTIMDIFIDPTSPDVNIDPNGFIDFNVDAMRNNTTVDPDELKYGRLISPSCALP